MSDRTISAINREIMRLRTEIAFVRGDMAHGGPNRTDAIKGYLHAIESLEFEKAAQLVVPSPGE